MATNGDDWSIQLSVKHGPLDDRGNPMYMTNVRGYTATEVKEHMQHLADHGPAITDACNAYAALETVQRHFETERVQPQQQQSRYGNNDNRGGQSSQGEVCEVHGLPRKKQSGTKNGKSWTGLFCDAPSNKCAPKWVD